jgi:hypothetical protein
MSSSARLASRPSLRRLTGGLAALALGVTLTACGGSDDSSAADTTGGSSGATSGATDEPSDVQSSDDTSTDDASPIDDGGEIAPDQFAAMIKDGIENTKTAHVSMSTSGGAGLQAEGDVDYASKPPNMQLSMKVAGQELNMVLVDSAMYIESPQSPGKFLRYDLTDPNNPLGSQLLDQIDPAQAMSQFADALSSVKSIGKEDVDGQQLAHYVMTIDTTKLANASQGAGMPAELTADVWLDDQNRMAKSSVDLGSGGGTYDTTLTKFDEPVSIKAPDPSKVIEAPTS